MDYGGVFLARSNSLKLKHLEETLFGNTQLCSFLLLLLLLLGYCDVFISSLR